MKKRKKGSRRLEKLTFEEITYTILFFIIYYKSLISCEMTHLHLLRSSFKSNQTRCGHPLSLRRRCFSLSLSLSPVVCHSLDQATVRVGFFKEELNLEAHSTVLIVMIKSEE
jgi:hypothetical protein